MKYRNIITETEKLLAGILFAGICAACSSEFSETETEELSGKTVQITSVHKEAVTKSDNPLLPPDDTYYLGYKTTVESTVNAKIHPLTINSGVIEGTTGKDDRYDSGLYWANVTKEAPGTAKFTLSNMEEKPDDTVYADEKDVLWDSREAWMAPLTFTLSHRMAQVSVELTSTLGDDVTIKSVSITSVKQSYKFLRESGTVEATASGTSLSLSKDDDTGKEVWSALLPPQDRDDNMALTVVISTGQTYSRKLPYSMIQNTGGNDTESIVLKFRQGYILNLTANITDDIDYTIFFTGATLENWLYKGEHSVVAKPAGIYTESELKDWVTKYNAYQENKSEKNREALLRYGTYKADETPQWTFTISRNIVVTTPDKFAKITKFYDKLERLNNYTINMSKDQLIGSVGSGATIEDDIFQQTTTP